MYRRIVHTRTRAHSRAHTHAHTHVCFHFLEGSRRATIGNATGRSSAAVAACGFDATFLPWSSFRTRRRHLYPGGACYRKLPRGRRPGRYLDDTLLACLFVTYRGVAATPAVVETTARHKEEEDSGRGGHVGGWPCRPRTNQVTRQRMLRAAFLNSAF